LLVLLRVTRKKKRISRYLPRFVSFLDVLHTWPWATAALLDQAFVAGLCLHAGSGSTEMRCGWRLQGRMVRWLEWPEEDDDSTRVEHGLPEQKLHGHA
jgi:hypothetical protein